MKIGYECIPCLLNVSKKTLELSKVSEKKALRILIEVSRFLSLNVTPESTTTEIGSELFRLLKRELKNPDPLKAVKEESNLKAFEIVKKLSNLDFEKSLKASLAGNLVDYSSESLEFDLEKDFFKVFREDLKIDETEELKKAIEGAKTILYVTDNCGEIIFDKLLLKHLKKKKLFIAAKSKPHSNDATIEDLKIWGFHDFGEIVETGTDSLRMRDSSPKFRRLFEICDLVILKGMAWFEDLSDEDLDKVFHIFRVKCSRVSRELGVPLGSNLVMRNTSKQLPLS
ncbi:MAG: DUF89 domain-containing protein [Candidatus Methanofastidiosia archaeon]